LPFRLSEKLVRLPYLSVVGLGCKRDCFRYVPFFLVIVWSIRSCWTTIFGHVAVSTISVSVKWFFPATSLIDFALLPSVKERNEFDPVISLLGRIGDFSNSVKQFGGAEIRCRSRQRTLGDINREGVKHVVAGSSGETLWHRTESSTGVRVSSRYNP